MVQLLNVTVSKFLCLGFLCGIIGSWLLSPYANNVFSRSPPNVPLYESPEEPIIDVQEFKEHGGHHEGKFYAQLLIRPAFCPI